MIIFTSPVEKHEYNRLSYIKYTIWTQNTYMDENIFSSSPFFDALTKQQH